MSVRLRVTPSKRPGVGAVALVGSLGLLGCAQGDDPDPASVPECEGSTEECLTRLAGSYAGPLAEASGGEVRVLLQGDGLARGSVTRLGVVESFSGRVEEDGGLVATSSGGLELVGSVSIDGQIDGTYQVATAARGFTARRVGPVFPPESGRKRGDGSHCERLARLSFECAMDLSVEYCTEPGGIDVCYAECLLGATCEELSDPRGSLGQLICQGACDSQFAGSASRDE